MSKRLSIEFFVCAALMLVFGAGFGSYGRRPVGLELALAAAVAGAGLLLLTGHEQARPVGIVVLGAVTLVGGVSTFSGSYMPGTIVALITLIRMLSAGSGATGGTGGGLPPDPSRAGQPSYGQAYGSAGTSQPYGGYGGVPPVQQQPATQPYVGDPRFGAPVPVQPQYPQPAPPPAPPAAPPAWPAPPAG